MNNLADNIRGAIIRNSMGTWENGGKTILDEVDLEDCVQDILQLIENLKKETPY